MRLLEALLASAFSNTLGIFALLALTQLIRHFGGIDWLPEIYGIEAAGLATVVPCVAIGGITLDNAPVLIEAGADFLAVCAAVWDHADGPRSAVRGFNSLMR